LGTDPNFEDYDVEDARICRIDYVWYMTTCYIATGSEAALAGRITHMPEAPFA
jgi:predicted GH43/DUF377 family glycosyl hydrolase